MFLVLMFLKSTESKSQTGCSVSLHSACANSVTKQQAKILYSTEDAILNVPKGNMVSSKRINSIEN